MPSKAHLHALALLILAGVAVAMPWSRPASLDARPRSAVSVTEQVIDTGFRPSRNGLAFRNPARDPRDPLFRQLTTEQCGGMAFVALDGFITGTAPVVESGTDMYLQMRSTQSVVANGARFALWSALPDRTDKRFGNGVITLTRQEELPKLEALLRKGPVPLGLVRARGLSHVGRNHQVVAYRMEKRGDTVLIGIYDPTQPGADDITLETDLADENGYVIEWAGEWEIARWRGFFVERYSPVSHPRR